MSDFILSVAAPNGKATRLVIATDPAGKERHRDEINVNKANDRLRFVRGLGVDDEEESRKLSAQIVARADQVDAAAEQEAEEARLERRRNRSATQPPAAAEEGKSAISRITNGIETMVPTKDGEDEKKTLQALPMDVVKNLIFGTTGDWPRRVDQSLFVPDGQGSVSWVLEPSALFGWLASKTGIVRWHTAKGCATKSEVFAEVIRTTRRYDAIEEMPHYPPLANHFYACPDVAPGDGAALRGLLDRFCPATDIDRDLIQVAIVTQFWGGPPGSRPAFVFTADAGRGKGKSKAAEMIGRITTGSIDFSANEDMGQIKTRLLSADALARRIALLDNVKSLRFSWAELEALITAPTVSGKRLFVGEGRRPNTLTWFITLNGASLSTDMAQRSVIIKIGEPQRSKLWEEETTDYIAKNRWKIIADAIGFLSSEPAGELASYSRWATWEAAILSRLPEPNDAQRVILERQGTVDVEREEAEVIHDHFQHQLDLKQANSVR